MTWQAVVPDMLMARKNGPAEFQRVEKLRIRRGLVNAGNRFLYVHPQRSDDTSRGYTVETRTNPLNGTWTNAGTTVTGTNVTGEELDFVSNQVDAVDNEKFIRLKIEQ